MSLSASPAIEIDCRAPRGVAALLVAGLAASLLPVLVFGLAGVIATLACLVLTPMLHDRVRWLRSESDFIATWAADGSWWLREGQGASLAARLRADSRAYASGVWLRWDTATGPRQALLMRRGRQAESIRRLTVRLRLEGLAAPVADSVAT